MNQWIGLTIGQILQQCDADFPDVQLLDEPPGKLRAVEFTCRAEQRPQRVILEINYHSSLFSSERRWPQDLVKAQKVVKVHYSRDTLF